MDLKFHEVFLGSVLVSHRLQLVFGSGGEIAHSGTLRLQDSFIGLHCFQGLIAGVCLIRNKRKKKRADDVRNPTGPRRSLIYYGYVVGALSLIPGYLGFSYLDSRLDAWSRSWGYRDLLLSSPLLALALGLGYYSAAPTTGRYKKRRLRIRCS